MVVEALAALAPQVAGRVERVAAGLAVGIPVIGVATGKYGEEDLRSSGATLTVADYSDLGDLLDWMGEFLR